ncbi:MAG: diaminopimelate epimerase [Actinomycetota bacterium]|nr:diaminopimelate epimerase [Actinomycetota bacterium]
MTFVKGHGTENDFVILPDPDGDLNLTPAVVAAMCDRRAGIGADGVLRVVLTAATPDVAHLAGEARWFMDYRNGDGSVAEMCGNGVRVYARYLVDSGYARPGRLRLATRSGVRTVDVPAEGDVTVGMGPARVSEPGAVTVQVGERSWPGTHVEIGNPHVVVIVDSLADAGPLDEPPTVTPASAVPDGANVEFVVLQGPSSIAMRVHERGAGETRSCGTGACAAMVAVSRARGDAPGSSYRVDVPGGILQVTDGPDEMLLSGPAVLVAYGEIRADWLAGK